MTPDTGQRLLVARDDLTRIAFAPDPDAPAQRSLADGEARLEVESFALTANNLTYAAFGEAMRYWQFFPATDAAWGCVPVWGYATVTESRAAGVERGQRLWGFLPAGSHLVVRPGRVHAGGFADDAAHRRELPAIYNQYTDCATDPLWQAAHEGLQAVLRPLFTTAFLLDDFLAGNGWFDARRLLLSSASSKTAYATAHRLALRRDGGGMPDLVGLTSPARMGFALGLGCYDGLLTYDSLEQLDRAVPTVYVDFAGDAALRRRVHRHFGQALRYSCSIGGTHWSALGPAADVPGPRPTLFFAPKQAALRAAPPPEGWGRRGLEQRIAQAWTQFLDRATAGATPWIRTVHASGPAAVEAAWRSLLDGSADAGTGILLDLRAQPGGSGVR